MTPYGFGVDQTDNSPIIIETENVSDQWTIKIHGAEGVRWTPKSAKFVDEAAALVMAKRAGFFLSGKTGDLLPGLTLEMLINELKDSNR